MLGKSFFMSWNHAQKEYRTKLDDEAVSLVTIDSWFIKLSEKLKFKCFQELASVKFQPPLNLKSTEQT